MAESLADISIWQGAIDWSAYAAWYRRTYPGATPKASIKATEGVGYSDPRYRDNEAGTRANGIQRVHYHYARPDLSTPEAEADWFWSVIAPHFQPGDLAELDKEQDAPGVNYESWKNRFFARLATYTARYGMYSAAWFMGPRGISWGPGFVHAAAYVATAPSCDIWQYSSSGSFPGMNGLIDSNLLLNPAIFGDATPGGPFMAALTDDEQREILALARKADETLGWVNPAADRAQKTLEWGTPVGGAVPQGWMPTQVAAILTAVTKPMDVDALAAALAAHIPVDVLATAIAAHVPKADAQAVATAVVNEYAKRLQA